VISVKVISLWIYRNSLSDSHFLLDKVKNIHYNTNVCFDIILQGGDVRIFMQLQNDKRNIERYTDDLKRVALDIGSEMIGCRSKFIVITSRKLTEPEYSAIRRMLTDILAPED